MATNKPKILDRPPLVLFSDSGPASLLSFSLPPSPLVLRPRLELDLAARTDRFIQEWRAADIPLTRFPSELDIAIVTLNALAPREFTYFPAPPTPVEEAACLAKRHTVHDHDSEVRFDSHTVLFCHLLRQKLGAVPSREPNDAQDKESHGCRMSERDYLGYLEFLQSFTESMRNAPAMILEHANAITARVLALEYLSDTRSLDIPLSGFLGIRQTRLLHQMDAFEVAISRIPEPAVSLLLHEQLGLINPGLNLLPTLRKLGSLPLTVRIYEENSYCREMLATICTLLNITNITFHGVSEQESLERLACALFIAPPYERSDDIFLSGLVALLSTFRGVLLGAEEHVSLLTGTPGKIERSLNQAGFASGAYSREAVPLSYGSLRFSEDPLTLSLYELHHHIVTAPVQKEARRYQGFLLTRQAA